MRIKISGYAKHSTWIDKKNFYNLGVPQRKTCLFRNFFQRLRVEKFADTGSCTNLVPELIAIQLKFERKCTLASLIAVKKIFESSVLLNFAFVWSYDQ